MTRRIDISYRTVIFISVFLGLLWLVFKIIDIILLFFVAFIFMSALSPLVDKLIKIKFPRVVAVLLVFITVIALIVGLFAIGLTPLITQTSDLTQKLIDVSDTLLQAHIIDQSLIKEQLSGFSGNLVNVTVDIFKNFIALVSVMVITIYMMLDRQKIEEYGTSFFGSRQEQAQSLLRRIEDKLGAWLRGQIILSFVIGICVYIGLTIFRVEYALPLAILAGLLEVVPVIGPIISAIPAILIALTVSPIFAALIAGFYIIVQQLEGHFIVPQVMKRAVGLNPLLVILAVSVGSRILGIGGALLAVPIAVVIQLILQEGLKTQEG